MDQTDFAIAMVSSILIIIVIFLFILFKIFAKKKKSRQIEALLPEITKIEIHETQPRKFVIKPQEIEGLEKEFQPGRELKKKGSVIEMMMEQKEAMPLNVPGKTMEPSNETVQIQKDTTEEPIKGSTVLIKEIPLSQPDIHSIEENEKLKLEDILIEIRDENTKKKAKLLKKKPIKRQIRKKSKKDQVPEKVKVSEKKSTGKKPAKKVSAKKINEEIVNEKPGSGEL